MGTLESYELDPEFVEGAVCVLSYLCCPEGKEMHGAEFASFLDNGLRVMESRPPRRGDERGRAVIETLKANGVEVVDAYVVTKGGN